MDPRLSGSGIRGVEYPKKRGPSKSPDGAHGRKQQKPDSPIGNGIPNNVDSRRSSISNGTTNVARPNLSAQSQLPPRPPPAAPMRKPSDGAILSSPRSPLESATSGRTTPQQRPSNLSKDTTPQLTKDTAPQLTNGVPAPNMDLSMDSMSLTDFLVKFSSDLASRAALEHERNQAQALLSGAQRQYNEMKKHFKSYPAIEERKNMDKKVAQEALKFKEKQLLENSTSQQEIAGALATIIGQLAAPKPNPDMVSRAEYDALKADMKQQAASMSQLWQDLTAAKQIADKANSKCGQLRQDVTVAKQIADRASSESGQVPKFYDDIEQLKKDRSTLLNWKEDAEPRFTGLVNFGQRLAGAEAKSTSTKKAFDDFMEQRVDQLATKQDVKALEATDTSIVNNIRELQKFQAKLAAEKMSSPSMAKESVAEPWLDERFQNLVDGQEKHDKEIKGLQLGGNQIFVDVQAKIDDTMKEQETMSQTLEQLGTHLVTSKENINSIRDSIEEEGKEIIVKRVKKLDILVNNLSSKLGNIHDASIIKRVSQLEEDCKALQEAARRTSTSYRSQSSPAISVNATAVDLEPIEARLDVLKNKLNAFITEQEDKDDMVEDVIKTVITAQTEVMSNRLTDEINSVREGIEPAIASAVQPLAKGYHTLQIAVDGFEEAMLSKAPSEAIDSLKTTLSTISEEVKKLQANHQRAKSTSHTPAPEYQRPQPNGAFQGVQQSPQLPNGVAGSPQINRPQSPYASPYLHGQQTQNAATTQLLQELQGQVNGLINVFQHLKMRCDNLQTDEVVKAMLDQFHSIYPDARNINATVSNLRNNVSSVQLQLSAMQQQNKSPTGEYSGEDVKKAIARADGASKSALQVSEHLQKIKTEINTIKEAVKSLEGTTPQNSASNDSGVQNQVTSLRADLDIATATANDADRLSKQHASRLSKIQPEELKKRVATLEGTVAKHTKDISTGEDAFKEFNNASASHQAEFDRVKKTAATNRQRILDLEEKSG